VCKSESGVECACLCLMSVSMCMNMRFCVLSIDIIIIVTYISRELRVTTKDYFEIVAHFREAFFLKITFS
jgi:hypothetical protein